MRREKEDYRLCVCVGGMSNKLLIRLQIRKKDQKMNLIPRENESELDEAEARRDRKQNVLKMLVTKNVHLL